MHVFGKNLKIMSRSFGLSVQPNACKLAGNQKPVRAVSHGYGRNCGRWKDRVTRERFTEEPISRVLRQTDVHSSQGKSIKPEIREFGITKQHYCGRQHTAERKHPRKAHIRSAVEHHWINGRITGECR